MKLYLSNVEMKTSTKTGRTFLIGECRKTPIDKFGRGSKVKCVIFDEEVVETVFKQGSDNNEVPFDFDMETIDGIWNAKESKQHPGVSLGYIQLVLNKLKSVEVESETFDLEKEIWS